MRYETSHENLLLGHGWISSGQRCCALRREEKSRGRRMEVPGDYASVSRYGDTNYLALASTEAQLADRGSQHGDCSSCRRQGSWP